MKKIIAIAALAAATAFATTQASAQMSGFNALGAANTDASIVHKTGRRGRRIGVGIALGIIGAAAIASHAHSYHYEDRYSRHERRCRKWRRRCNYGNDQACWRYDNRC